MGFVPITIEDYVAKHRANNPEEEMLCNLTRYDQRNDEEFNCCAFIKK